MSMALLRMSFLKVLTVYSGGCRVLMLLNVTFSVMESEAILLVLD